MRNASVRLVALVFAAVATTSCGGDSTAPNLSTTGPITKFVVNSVTFPTTVGQYGLDLTGDGSADNQLGSVIVAYSQVGLDMQALENAGIASGAMVQLISLQADDANFLADAVAGVSVSVGNPAAGAPGAGPYTVDGSYPAGSFIGNLANYALISRSPVTTTAPVAMTLRVNLFGAPVSIPLNGARISFTVVPGTSPSLINGQINGSIRALDMQNQIEPSIAAGISAFIAADSANPGALALRTLFDTGGCGGAQVDGVISLCEVTENPLFSSLIMPDLEIYTGAGAYHPNPANTNPNAISFGIGFTAIKTTY